MAGVEALIAPKPFKSKDKDPETLLVDYDLYIKAVKNFFVATGKEAAPNKQKLALLQAVGGVDMIDLLEETGKVVLEAVAADARAGIAAVAADTFDKAVEKIRQGIVSKTNQAMSRLKLSQQMEQGSQKFESWTREIFKQSQRCDWTGYNAEEAARDAILYHTTDNKLRKNILADNMSYKDTITWGRAHEESSRKAKVVEDTSTKHDSRVRKLEEKLGRLETRDKRDKTKSHPPGQTFLYLLCLFAQVRML
jgi:hypothetical protein